MRIIVVCVFLCGVFSLAHSERNQRRRGNRRKDRIDEERIDEDVSDEGMTPMNLTSVNSTYFPPTLRRPGFRARITQKGFDFAANFATEFLMVQMKKFKVPDIEEDIATTHVTVSNIHVEEFPEPKNKISILSDKGLRWETWNMQPIFAAGYKATMGMGWFTVEKIGNVTVTCTGMKFKLDFNVDRDPYNGRPFLLTTDCQAEGNVEISFEGGWSDILNAGSTILSPFIQGTIMDQICSQARSEIDVNLQSELLTLPMVESVGDLLELDFSFTDFPTLHKNYLETSHKGVVYFTPDPHEPPFEAPVIPEFTKHKKRMVYLYVTDYMVNSGLYAAFLSGQMSFNVTEDIRHLVPSDALAILNLMCSSPDVCIGSVFPQLNRMFAPHLLVEVDMYAVQPPSIHFIRGTKAQMFTYSEAKFFIKHDNNTRAHMFTAQVNVSSSVRVVVNGSRISFIIKDVRPAAIVTESSIGNVKKGRAFQKLLKIGAEKFVMQQIAVHAQEGFEIPSTEDMRFENSVILPVKIKGLFVVATDFYINPDLDLQGMIQEQLPLLTNGTTTANATAQPDLDI